MKVQLFHAPRVDDDGVERRDLCAVVTGVGGNDVTFLNQFADSLREGHRVLAFERSDVVVEWL